MGHAITAKYDILRWWRLTFENGTVLIEQSYAPPKMHGVVSAEPFLSYGDAQTGKDRTPETKGFRACYFCEYFHRSERFCVVNPSQVLKGHECSDRVKRYSFD